MPKYKYQNVVLYKGNKVRIFDTYTYDIYKSPLNWLASRIRGGWRTKEYDRGRAIKYYILPNRLGIGKWVNEYELKEIPLVDPNDILKELLCSK